jgi:transcriptional regulator with XRE-family HTH domain
MIGDFLLQVRRAAGLSQAQVAALSGIPQPNLSAFERGRRMPSAANLLRIVDACGLRLVATAGSTRVLAPSPSTDQVDERLLDELFAEPDASPPPEVLSEDERALRSEAVLALADGLVRLRAGAR